MKTKGCHLTSDMVGIWETHKPYKTMKPTTIHPIWMNGRHTFLASLRLSHKNRKTRVVPLVLWWSLPITLSCQQVLMDWLAVSMTRPVYLTTLTKSLSGFATQKQMRSLTAVGRVSHWKAVRSSLRNFRVCFAVILSCNQVLPRFAPMIRSFGMTMRLTHLLITERKHFSVKPGFR